MSDLCLQRFSNFMDLDEFCAFLAYRRTYMRRLALNWTHQIVSSLFYTRQKPSRILWIVTLVRETLSINLDFIFYLVFTVTVGRSLERNEELRFVLLQAVTTVESQFVEFVVTTIDCRRWHPLPPPRLVVCIKEILLMT